MKIHHYWWCPVSKSSNFDNNFMKLIHNTMTLSEFDNGRYGFMPSCVIALCWWKNPNFYDVLSLNCVILIRTVSNLFTILSTKMSFPISNIVYIAIISSGVIALCSWNFAIICLGNMIQNVLLMLQYDAYHLVASRVIALCSLRCLFCFCLWQYANFATAGASMSLGHISSYLWLNRTVVSYWPRCEYTRYWWTLFILDTSKHILW